MWTGREEKGSVKQFAIHKKKKQTRSVALLLSDKYDFKDRVRVAKKERMQWCHAVVLYVYVLCVLCFCNHFLLSTCMYGCK